MKYLLDYMISLLPPTNASDLEATLATELLHLPSTFKHVIGFLSPFLH